MPLVQRAAVHVSTQLQFGAWVLALVACLACGSERGGASPLPTGCQPLGDGSDCLAPFPSDYFLVADATTATGRRVVVPRPSAPRTREGAVVDPFAASTEDGFSTIPMIVARLPGAVTDEGLPGPLDRAERSTGADAPTLLVEVATGRRIAHYVDVHAIASDPSRRPITLHPLAPLAPRTTYVVALRGVRDESGGRAPAAAGFALIRDGEVAATAELAAAARRFEELELPALEAHGVRREELQLAWSFTTGSEEGPRRDMLRVAAQTHAWLDRGPPRVRVEQVIDRPRAAIARVVRGTFDVPMFVDRDGPGAQLSRDADGDVVQRGVVRAPFRVVVPESATRGDEPALALVYGHGFFGWHDEIESGRTPEIGDGLRAVLFSTPWVGMSKQDTDVLVESLTGDPSEVARFSDRVHQAMASFLVLTRAVRTTLRDLPELQRESAGGAAPYFDADHPALLGVSQGHILTGTLAALTHDVTRVALHAGGGGLTHVMPRSAAFAPFLFLLERTVPDALDRLVVLAMAQRRLDRIDPVTYAPLVTRPSAGRASTPRVLMQVAADDAAVPAISAYLHARALGLTLDAPSVVDVPAMERATASTPSWLTVFSLDGRVDVPRGPETPPLSASHDLLRMQPEVQVQLREFLRAGGAPSRVCAGPCALRTD